MRHFAHAVQVALVARLFRDDEDVCQRCHVAVHIDVGEVECLLAVDVQRVGVEFRKKFLGGVRPHALVVLRQLCHSWRVHLAHRCVYFALWQEVAGHCYRLSLRCEDVECHGVVGIHYG